MAAPWKVMPLVSRLLYRLSVQPIRAVRAGGPRVKPETEGDMKRDYQDLLRQFPKPKEILHRFFARSLGTSNVGDKFTYVTASSDQDHRVILQIKWPIQIEVEGCGRQKVKAERHAAAQACKMLQDLGYFSAGKEFGRSKLKPSSSAHSSSEVIRSARAEQRHPVLDSAEDLEAMKALKTFPQAKNLLSNVIQVATSSAHKNYVRYQHEGGHIKTCRLTLSWPEPLTFVGYGRRRAEAEKKAAALGCQKLKDLGLLDPNNKPLTNAMYNQTAIQELRQHQKQARRFQLPEELLVRMENYFQEFPLELGSEFGSDVDESSASEMETADDRSHDASFTDPITGQPYIPLSDSQSDLISLSLDVKWRSSQEGPLQELPADNHKAAILAAIKDNPVVMIAGDTGCGKTTRIPRFILEDAILGGQGAQCNILITQPRRISAVSVAHRVAQELGPALRRNSGYQVRLESRPPPRGGALLFCTVGILLKKLQTNPTMEGVSHVIVDEVHERDVSTDFLIILLKQMQQLNPNIKVILMSATGDNQLISNYFGSCPIVRVPGFMYPVKQHYLEDVLPMMGMSRYRPPESHGECSPDLDLISKVILRVDQHGEPGSILCFLPGWQEIREVQNTLQEALSDQDERYLILPVHSNVPLVNQQIIFQRPPAGVRKIILATNIAETSVTIDDIVHVVDCGMQKEQRYDVRTKVSCLETAWVSKSNIIQRRGRAGRCQPGFSYHLFTRQQHEEMADFQVPEILRTPLENLVLQAKIHTPELTAVEFLSQALECPDPPAIRDAVRLLQQLRVLDEDEKLTLLGQRVAHISTDPSLAKAIVLAAMFRCLQPLLTIVASLTRDPFLGGILNRAEVNKTKEKFSGNMCSDHLAFVRIFQAWREVQPTTAFRDFLQENVLSRSALIYIHGLILQFASNAYDAFLVPSPKDCEHYGALCNQFSDQDELVKGVLLAGLYPNLIQVRRGKVIDGKFRPNSLMYKSQGGPVQLHKSTVNRDKRHFRSPWLTYFQAVKSTGVVFVRDSSMVHPLAILLMTDSSITCKDNGHQMVVSLSDSDLMKLESDRRTIQLLGALRQALRNMVEWNLKDRLSLLSAHNEHQHSELLSILAEILNRTADSFRDPSESEQ